jgi:hypothetical protein
MVLARLMRLGGAAICGPHQMEITTAAPKHAIASNRRPAITTVWRWDLSALTSMGVPSALELCQGTTDTALHPPGHPISPPGPPNKIAFILLPQPMQAPVQRGIAENTSHG